MSGLGRAYDDNLIWRVGREVTWEQATRCPCVGSDGRPDRTCSRGCDRDGYLYAAPQPMRALLHGDGRDDSHDSSVAGLWEEGSCTATISASFEGIGDRDRIVCSELYPVRKNLQVKRSSSGDRDPIPAPFVIDVLKADTTAKELVSGFDYTIEPRTYDASGNPVYWDLVWLNEGAKPASGGRTSLLLRVRAAWRIDGHPMIRQVQHGRVGRLPWKAHLKRYDAAVTDGY